MIGMIKKNKLSIIVTAHSEGILLHKTLLSVSESVAELKDAGIDYEIIIHVDKVDAKTKAYLDTHPNKEYTIYYNDFGDLGLSRNFAISKASGNLVAVIDGDDLVSPNWFRVACETILNSKDEVVVHPEHNFTFGIGVWHHVLWTQADSEDLDTDKLLLAGVNCWASCCAARKETFLNFPYPKAENGFGNEDWCFNCATRNAGILHLVGKNTVQFYRRKADSLLSANTSNKLVQWPNPLFDLMEYKKIPLPTTTPKAQRKGSAYYFKRAFRLTHGTMLRTPLKYVLIPSAKVVKKVIHYKQNDQKAVEKKKLPECVYKEWQTINHIESQLYPVGWRINEVEFYTNTDKFNIGRALRLIVEPLKAMPDYVFIIPWLKTGGADKVVLNYIEAISKIHPEWHFAVITTLPSNNEWKNKLPENAYLLDFGNITKDLEGYEREGVFARLLVELRCRRIHLINSQYGYDFISSHKELISKNFDLTVSVFNYEFIPGSNCKGVYEYADPYLVDIYEETKKIYTDNAAFVERCIKRNGFSKEKFSVHYQPISIKETSIEQSPRGEKTKIFWASRIAYQKNPEVLIEIAKKLDSSKYTIDVYGELDEDYKKSDFENIPSLTYKGKFNGLNSIDTSSYDVFLYTSRSDGVPNTILEVANLEIPIIASNVGGVGEFVKSDKTGYLVDDFENADEYIKALEDLSKHFDDAKQKAQNAKKLLEKQHSWDEFIKSVKKDID